MTVEVLAALNEVSNDASKHITKRLQPISARPGLVQGRRSVISFHIFAPFPRTNATAASPVECTARYSLFFWELLLLPAGRRDGGRVRFQFCVVVKSQTSGYEFFISFTNMKYVSRHSLINKNDASGDLVDTEGRLGYTFKKVSFSDILVQFQKWASAL